MSVLIKGIKIPNDCYDCVFCTEGYYCNLVGEKIPLFESKRRDDCPLVELPEHHGRLIDEKELRKAVLKWLPPDPCGREEKEFPFEEDICVSMMMEIEEQPTVVEEE